VPISSDSIRPALGWRRRPQAIWLDAQRILSGRRHLLRARYVLLRDPDPLHVRMIPLPAATERRPLARPRRKSERRRTGQRFGWLGSSGVLLDDSTNER
jgi:hypothetical protein